MPRLPSFPCFHAVRLVQFTRPTRFSAVDDWNKETKQNGLALSFSPQRHRSCRADQGTFPISGDQIKFSFSHLGKPEIIKLPVYKDSLSGFNYFFSVFPIEYLHHDDRINPRTIGKNISKLVKEFYEKYPQLHVALGWIE